MKGASTRPPFAAGPENQGAAAQATRNDSSAAAHTGQFYADEALLCDRVAEFLHQGLLAGDDLVVISTPAHRELLMDRLAQLTQLTNLTRNGAAFDRSELSARGQLTLLDAEETLAKIMVGDSPEWSRFQQVMGDALHKRAHGQGCLRAYGEMIDVLWRGGNAQAAIRLEELWNELARSHSSGLLCAYVMGNFYNCQASARRNDAVIATDTPREPPARAAGDLAAEIVARRSLEAELRLSIQELRRAEDDARASAARMAELQKATARMATALDVSAVGEILLSVSERVLGACAGVFYLGNDQGQYCLEAAQGVPEAVRQWRVLPLDSVLPLADAINTGNPVWIEEYAPRVALPGEGAGRGGDGEDTAGLQAIAAIPILQGTRVLGGFALSFGAARKFQEGERRWLESFASQCGLAIERARLYEGEQRARSEAETLFRIAESLNSTQLDRDAIVQRVTDEATAMVGAEIGAFLYNVADQDGGVHVLSAQSGAPHGEFAQFGLPRSPPLLPPSFATSLAGEAVIRVADITKDSRYAQMDWPRGAAGGQLPVTSYLSVRLTGRDGGMLGALFFGHSQPGRFTAHHERMIKTLAMTASVAVENANLFRATRDADEKHRRLVDDLTETVRLNELFAGVLAHDLRNPLASIMTAAQVSLARTADERLTKPMNRIMKSGERMLRMIEQLLDFTRIRVGNGMPINARQLDLAPLLRQVADELRAGGPESLIDIQCLGDSSGAWDEDRLGQVFSNLLGNAVHHGRPEPGAAAPNVGVQIDGRDKDTIQVRVHNAGTIPAGTGSHLFEPFATRDRQPERSRGLGLGLFISRAIVREHGGSLAVESTESDGTTFTVSLPRFALAVQPPSSSRQSRSLQEAQEQLRGSEERFRLLVETVRDYAIFMLDPTGRVQTWNAGAERIKGYRASEIIGQHFSKFYDEALVKAGFCQRELEIAARDGRFEDEGWRLRKDGSKFWASVIITALRHPAGELLGFAKVTRDLTDRRKLEAERIRLVHAQEAIRLRDEFLSIVSHELKTPLAGLQLQLENLQRRLGVSDQITATQLRRATDSGQRLASLIESLLDASRIATGRMVLVPERFDLSEAVREVVAKVEPAATKAGCDLLARLEGPVEGVWDRGRLQQALTNLLSNAIKYGSGRQIEISLSRAGAFGEQNAVGRQAGEPQPGGAGGADDRDEVTLEVTDHGPGVPAEDLARIFGRFERAVPIQHHGGLGLGLYVVREIASAHGGSITAENLAQGGARFSLRLPLKVAAPGRGMPEGTSAANLRRESN